MTEEAKLLTRINAELETIRELQAMQGDWANWMDILSACDRTQKLFDEYMACIEVRLLLERV